MKKSLLMVALLGGVVFQPALAQQAIVVEPSTPNVQQGHLVVAPPPLVRAQLAAQEQAIQLTNLTIQTQIYGNVASTTYDMTFYNPNDRVLEGELEFPLFGHQQVVGYSLDINGHQREGVVTDKQLARQAFEEKVKQGIDPGIIEKTAGNNYKTRIYPLLPKQTRRVTITYEEVLSKQQDSYLYNLALNYSQPIKDFSYEVKLLELGSKPEFVEALSGLSFENVGQSGYFAKLTKTGFTPNQNIKIRVPVRHEVQQFYEQHHDGLFTLVNVPLEKEWLAAQAKAKPKNIAVVWDDSLSAKRGGRDVKKEAQLVKQYLSYLSLNADVYTFDTVFEKRGQFSAEQIEQALVDFPTIGGTDFSVIDSKVLNGYDEVIIVSDGLNNLGEMQIKDQLKTRVVTVNSAAQSNERYLEYLAGGQLLNLSKLSVEDALTALKVEPLTVSEIFYDKNVVQEIYHANLQPNDQSLSLMAKLAAGKTTIRVVFKKGNETFERSIHVDGNGKGKGSTKGVARLFGSEKIRFLEMDAEKNRQDIIDVAKQFTIVTDYTSLIVLDDVNDYVRYKIVPPRELRPQYDELVQQQTDSKKEIRAQRLGELRATFEQMKRWYTAQYSTKKLKVARQEENEQYAADANEGRVMASASPPLPVEASSLPQSPRPEPVPAQQVQEAVVVESGVATETEFLRSDSDQRERSALAAHKDMPMMAGTTTTTTNAVDGFSGGDAGVNFVVTDAGKMGVGAGEGAESKPVPPAEVAVNTKNIDIELKAWSPDAAYMKEIKATSSANLKKVYFGLQKQYIDQPAFYMDMADFFSQKGDKVFAARIVLSIADLNLEDVELLRALGYKLMELGQYEYAIEVFEKLVELRGEDQQSYRDLGLVYERTGHQQLALEKLYYALTGDFTRMHPGVDQTLLMELNHLIALNPKLDISRVDKDLVMAMPVDLYVVIDWNFDSTDIDLWVSDPHGFKVYYSDPLSPSGGCISQDVTTGFGPEAFAQKKALSGTYKIQVEQFGSSSQKVRVHGAAIVKATVFTNYGSKNEKSQEMVVRLDHNKDVVDIGKFRY